MYLVYLSIVIIVAQGNRDPNSFYMKVMGGLAIVPFKSSFFRTTFKQHWYMEVFCVVGLKVILAMRMKIYQLGIIHSVVILSLILT